jgi:hypothetical protein
MSRSTRVRLVDARLQLALTGQHALMAVDCHVLWGIAELVSLGRTLSASQQSLVSASAQVLADDGVLPLTPVPTLLADPSALRELADAAAVEQRQRVTVALEAALADDAWLVTVVPGRSPDRFTGLEATRGDEHLVAALGAGEVVIDQSGAVDCLRTVAKLTEALATLGCHVRVDDDVEHDGRGGPLYGLPGGPTRAHAVESALRPAPPRPRRTSRAPATDVDEATRSEMGLA